MILIILCLPIKSQGDEGHGDVNIRGAIIATACAIDTDSQNQTIEMFPQSASALLRNGLGREKPFSIKLIGCSFGTDDQSSTIWQYVQITFEGPVYKDLFKTQGTAHGVALQIEDAQRNIMHPFVAGLPIPITPGNMRMDYYLRLKSVSSAIQAGDYSSVIRFSLKYF